MRLFDCQACGNSLHFENANCVDCGHLLGYIPERTTLSALEPDGDGWRPLAEPNSHYRFCANAVEGACNWLIPGDSPETLCASCRYNLVVPDLKEEGNHRAWVAIEQAKHYLVYSLLRWQLPVPNRMDDPQEGLGFEFLADIVGPGGEIEHVTTGHDHGRITINISEADDAEREARRTAMGEPYRTLLGHFRHEIGHYYWDRLVRDTPERLEAYRALFGDDRADYGASLARHYESGPPPDWSLRFISAYANAHPWEDFAETWAHYMHMVDALETAHAYGLILRPKAARQAPLSGTVSFDPYLNGTIDDLTRAWVPLTVAVNSLNRSLGQPDLYPFVMSEAIIAKLAFIHDLVRSSAVTVERVAA
jgi:hypothetical protein